MREFLAKIPDHGPAIVAGDLNTTTIAMHSPRAICRGAYQFLREPRRLSDPRRWETLFARLTQAGFQTDGANAPGKRTFTFSRAIPRWLRPNLDWIAVRGLEPLHSSARTVAARPSFFRRRLSDHDFIMCEVRL
ncbi:MAG: hypothetical protein ACREEA_10520 [Stellaceae bacterium]